MKTLAAIALAAFATAAVLPLAACESDMHGGATVGYVDGYYDDFYGPIYDGYWGDGDVFFFRDRADHDYRRDDAHHFRRDSIQGFHTFHNRAGHPSEQHG